MTKTANAPDNGASAATTAQNRREPLKLMEQVGSTTIEVSIHFSNTSKETLEDKIFRLILSQSGRPLGKPHGREAIENAS